MSNSKTWRDCMEVAEVSWSCKWCEPFEVAVECETLSSPNCNNYGNGGPLF